MTARDILIERVRHRGWEPRKEPFRLASGQLSHDYVDGKRAIGDGVGLRLVAEAVIELTKDEGVEFEAVGGLTMGADPLSHAVAIVTGKGWFSVRKAAKEHGKQRLIEGCDVTPGMKVLVVDDVVTTGGSVEQALDALLGIGAEVVLVATLLDRGDVASARMAARGIRYRPLATYRDIGIAPVGDGREFASTS